MMNNHYLDKIPSCFLNTHRLHPVMLEPFKVERYNWDLLNWIPIAESCIKKLVTSKNNWKCYVVRCCIYFLSHCTFGLVVIGIDDGASLTKGVGRWARTAQWPKTFVLWHVLRPSMLRMSGQIYILPRVQSISLTISEQSVSMTS